MQYLILLKCISCNHHHHNLSDVQFMSALLSVSNYLFSSKSKKVKKYNFKSFL